jgi:hypothetical protein
LPASISFFMSSNLSSRAKPRYPLVNYQACIVPITHVRRQLSGHKTGLTLSLYKGESNGHKAKMRAQPEGT